MNFKQHVEDLFCKNLIWNAEATSLAKSDVVASADGVRLHTHHHYSANPSIAAPFGCTEIDSHLPSGGLPCGAVHEWFLDFNLAPPIHNQGEAPSLAQTASLETQLSSETLPPKKRTARRSKLTPPPISLFALLAHNARTLPSHRNKCTVWIGSLFRPSPLLLQQTDNLSSSIFLDPPDEKSLLWSIDTALRSPAVGVVITYLKNLSVPLSRRFTLAARTGGAIALFLRPERARLQPTTCTSRWRLSPYRHDPLHFEQAASFVEAPCFKLELLKYKGQQPTRTQWRFQLQEGEQPSVSIERATYVDTPTPSLSLHIFPNLERRPRTSTVEESWQTPERRSGT